MNIILTKVSLLLRLLVSTKSFTGSYTSNHKYLPVWVSYSLTYYIYPTLTRGILDRTIQIDTVTLPISTLSSESLAPDLSGWCIFWTTLTPFICRWESFCVPELLSELPLTSSWSITAFFADSTKMDKPLQACMPSDHVWSKCLSPASPQFLNQAPPSAR